MKRLVLIFQALTCILSCQAQSSPNKIPIDPERWYQVNNLDFRSKGLYGLFDGVISERVHTGYGKILSSYDSYYPLADGEEMTIDSIRFYDGANIYANTPMVLSIINDKWQRIPLARFSGELYNTWVGPYSDSPREFALRSTATNVRYLVITSTSSSFPNEIELYGTYKSGKGSSPVPRKMVQLRQNFGVNAFEWNFESAQQPTVIDEKRMKAVESFTGVRHYVDWQKLESTQGSYTFNPTHSGGWNYDAIYERCKKEGIEVLACLKTIPAWMKATYPADLQDDENVPVTYGKDFSDTRSYTEQAKLGFQFAARYGNNKNIDTSLLQINKTVRWKNDIANVAKTGLGLIKYIECDNERDKWWKGRKAYQTAREYAANLSAFYDGHKNTMGPGIGVKNADPAMKVVIGGLAGANIDYVKGMIDWCKEFRGYNPDGTVNLCWDVINYHYYSNDKHSSQSGTSTRGAAPEISGAAEVAKQFLKIAHDYAYDMPVWITETGYDINQASPLKAIAINNKSVLETQADWILRSSLLYARLGIEAVFFYQLYDNAPLDGGRFNTSGLLNGDRSRRPAADFLYQANQLIGKYFYKETIHSNSNAIVDRYEANGHSAWVLVVPDERGRVAYYTLDLGSAAFAKIYRPRAGQDSMRVDTVKTTDGKLTVRVTETPVFILPVEEAISARTAVNTNSVVVESITQDEQQDTAAKIYPNPTSDFFFIELHNKSKQDVKVNILNANGSLCQTQQFKKYSDKFLEKIRMNATLPFGLYFIEIRQGSEKVVKKIIRSQAIKSNF
ncbi:T9SS type A sorting domain-containing protein [Terrimonas alba]|uniref:T9SS type A sorting domain-containing protein n=1 Tax=Terrimonas alba TaxID=3349636 RepID=UPI0035F2943D